MMRLLIVVMNCLVLISNVQTFATSQFAKIPKNVGGGKPETAYIKMSPEHQELAQSLNIPSTTNLVVAKGFVGPIAVLLRSDKEVIFLNYADMTASAYLTNETISLFPTNIVISTQTTLLPPIITTQTDLMTTSVTLKTVITVVTNKTSVTKTVSKNQARMTARQIRADLIDAVIFTK